MRKSNLELPSPEELREIRRAESGRRAIKYDFIDKNIDAFTAYRKLAAENSISTDWVEGFRQLSLETVLEKVRVATDALAGVLLTDPHYQNELFDSLVATKQPTAADGIFVFGSPSDARIKRAVELYEDRFASKIYISGHRPYYLQTGQSESQRMREFAIAHGVRPQDILEESRSITLPDNVKTMLNEFDAQKIRPRKLIIVASTYVLLRASMEWYRFTPWNVEIIPVSAHESDLSESLRRDMWWRSEQGIRQLLNEYAKIIVEHRMDIEEEAT